MAETGLLLAKAAAQRALGQVQPRCDRGHVRQSAAALQQQFAHPTCQSITCPIALQQLPTLLLAGLPNRRVIAGQTAGQQYRVQFQQGFRGIELRGAAIGLGVGTYQCIRRRGQRQPDRFERLPQPGQLPVDTGNGRAVTQQQKGPQARFDPAIINDQPSPNGVLAGLDAAEGKGQIKVAQAHFQRLAQRRTAEQRIPPDAVATQLITAPGQQTEQRLIRQVGEQIADHLQLLIRGDLGLTIGQRHHIQPGALQALRYGQAQLGTQLGHQLHATDVAQARPGRSSSGHGVSETHNFLTDYAIPAPTGNT